MSKKLGELAELKFYMKSYEKDFIVSKPFGDNAKYDFVVDSGRLLMRVQVKSTSYNEKANRQDCYKILVAYGNKNRGLKVYTAQDVDIIAAYVAPHDTWYIIPISAINGKISLRLIPHRPSKGKMERYKEAWDIFEL